MLRYTIRSLLKAPGFTVAAIVSLALGIGANTAIFSLLDAIVLRSLPVRAPGERVAFGAPHKSGLVGTAFSYPFYLQVAANPAFAGVLASSGWAAKLGTGAEAERTSVEAVSGNYFAVLGVRPRVGRSLAEDSLVAVLSDSFWRRRFAGDPAAVGREIMVNDSAFTISGVAPPGFFARLGPGIRPSRRLREAFPSRGNRPIETTAAQLGCRLGSCWRGLRQRGQASAGPLATLEVCSWL